jgi:hypothetical protein
VPTGGGLVAITDGLVERRDADIDVGIERLLAATADRSMVASAYALLRRIVAAAPPVGTQDDDVTVLTLYRY